MADPDRFFQFTVPGAISLGATLDLTGQYEIGTVTVSGAGSSWFSFGTHGGHIEGNGATVMFSFYSEKGKLYIQVDANGPDGRLQKCRFSAARSGVCRTPGGSTSPKTCGATWRST